MKTLVLALIAAVLLTASAASAQVVQPTYVRPSKGASIQILSAPATNGTTTFTSSAIFDWTAFAGVTVTVTAPPFTGPSLQPYCSYGVRVRAMGGNNTVKTQFFELNAPSSTVEANTSQSYFVRVLPGYLYFQLESFAATFGTACTGNYTVTVTPQPFDYTGQSTTGNRFNYFDTTSSGSPVYVSSRPQYPTLRLQNVGVTRTSCIPFPNDGSISTLTQFPIQLEAESSAGAGNGGTVEIKGWVGTLQCYGKFVYLQY